MNLTARVLVSQLKNVARSRWVIGYGLLLLLSTGLLLRFGGTGDRALLSLLNVVLLLLPLVSVMFGVLYVHNSREFIELLLAQPVGRGSLYAGLFFGIVTPLVFAFLLGVGAPLLLHCGAPEYFGRCALLLGAGTLLTIAFTALAVAVAVWFEDRARALGMALLVWLVCALVYDGLLLFVATTFAEYPLETPLLVMVFLNPVDLARVALLMSFDVSALMGYTGAVYEKFFGAGGMILAFLALLVSGVVPFLLGRRWFLRKDF
jgi:Cu-processing system permease protein